jgi:hypothetical protein
MEEYIVSVTRKDTIIMIYRVESPDIRFALDWALWMNREQVLYATVVPYKKLHLFHVEGSLKKVE